MEAVNDFGDVDSTDSVHFKCPIKLEGEEGFTDSFFGPVEEVASCAPRKPLTCVPNATIRFFLILYASHFHSSY
jgi:hypothetical protein